MRRNTALMALVVALLAAACGGGDGDEAAAGPVAGGRALFSGRCSVCHGDRGEGGVGPALADVAATFPSCADQVRWISLGSSGWKRDVGATYGATSKPIEGAAMPAFAATLDPAEIRLVAAWERAEFGGVDPAEAAADCDVG